MCRSNHKSEIKNHKSPFPHGCARGWILGLLGVVLSAATAGGAPLPAFPGAQGFGASTPGGRGGKVLFVTNLRDYDPDKESPVRGSLRAACETEGARTVLFRVSGTIPLKATLLITEPYLTLAGQTAPGDGICLKNYGTYLKDTHDVIIRYMRFRPGDEVGRRLAKEGKSWEADAVEGIGCSNVILDHCSTSWGNDEVLSFTYLTDITVQWCFITESLNRSTHPKGPHGLGSLVCCWRVGRATQHHNLWAYHTDRCPNPGTDPDCEGSGLLYDFRNNVIFMGNRGYSWPRHDKIRMNYVGNFILSGYVFSATPGMRMYLSANLHNRKNTGWDMIRGKFTKMSKPFAVPPVETDSAAKAFQRVLAEAGATLPARDAVDSRIVASIRAGEGAIIDTQEQVGGWPELKTLPAPADVDDDGMPDEWEKKHRLRPTTADHNGDVDGDGYTNLEEYLNQTDPRLRDSGQPLCPADADKPHG